MGTSCLIHLAETHWPGETYTLQQIESYLLMRHYEGMMKSGRVKGRSQFAAA